MTALVGAFVQQAFNLLDEAIRFGAIAQMGCPAPRADERGKETGNAVVRTNDVIRQEVQIERDVQWPHMVIATHSTRHFPSLPDAHHP